jgi:MoaA/NifB/PqqE/SkfB family radical SAM enzyme
VVRVYDSFPTKFVPVLRKVEQGIFGFANISQTESGPVAWFRQFFKRNENAAVERWRVLQIEVTSRCPLRCTFCPNKSLGKNWIHGDLPWSIFDECIAPHLPRFELAYLQGWGEPLLHPQLWEMIRATKDAGCRVGFTTCGNFLDETNGARLLDAGVDILSISFAGATPATHEALRVGSDFRKLAANVERVARLKKERRLAAPTIELHFLMLHANIHELPDFVQFAASLGADQVVATNVAYAPTREIEAQRVFAESPEPRHRAFVVDAEREAKRLGITFHAYPLAMDQNILECDAQPSETAYVNHLGQVSPCVYLGLPIKDRAPRFFQGQDRSVASVNFGNSCLDLIAALQGAERAEFVGAFRSRKAFAYSALALFVASGARDAMRLPDPPPACRACYKLYGI